MGDAGASPVTRRSDRDGFVPGFSQVEACRGAAVGALAGAGGLATPAVTQAQATPIRHVVVIFLENHSFDSLLGAAGLTWKLYGANSTQGGYTWSICPAFAECLDTSQDANLVPDAQFLTAAGAGTLPSFSVVT